MCPGFEGIRSLHHEVHEEHEVEVIPGFLFFVNFVSFVVDPLSSPDFSSPIPLRALCGYPLLPLQNATHHFAFLHPHFRSPSVSAIFLPGHRAGTVDLS